MKREYIMPTISCALTMAILAVAAHFGGVHALAMLICILVAIVSGFIGARYIV